ncbi:hypothetical protein A4H97_17840 [Niastella yeongjuensis]|uniref:RNA polymerase sigma-70 factor n=1 Tax=Niastella yeongjuensis TaxID=354355 RepID=A0A1V9E2C6_9BACT|nr:RNA polymerase sigma-70 factor [Niastella yeongjuensis]OQP40075.1 hypothetical protein A4H97_17840 [Niastella yeongjuensis]SEO16045.1 RNA polymerase sigma-70 factor, ECF subfamily [Niastella yeongjuensis]
MGKVYIENVLLQATAEGDEKAFSEIFNHYRNKIYSFACRLTGSTDVADEILLDVFLRVWMKREELPEIKLFQAWLFTITRNRVFSTLKQMALRKEAENSFEKGNNLLLESTPHDFLLDKEYQDVLQKAVAQLPPQQKKVYMLIKEYGMKREEAAQELNLSPETVKHYLSEAMYSVRTYCLAHLGVYATLLIIKDLY